MCGRYNVTPNAEAFVDVFDIVHGIDVLPSEPMYNIAPSGIRIPIVRKHHDGNQLINAGWPLIPFWFKGRALRFSTANAKGETLAEKPAYRGPWKKGQRCLIPANGYYEWQQIKDTKVKQPFHICMQDRSLFAFAGLWDGWRDENGDAVESCTIITTTPNELLAPIHQRMPVIVAKENYADWLNSSSQEATSLIQPFKEASLIAYPVTTYVNSPRNNDAQCFAPIDDALSG